MPSGATSMPKIAAWIGAVAAALLTSARSDAATDLGTHTLRISADLTSLNCTLETVSGQVINLGSMSSGIVRNAPSSLDDSALSYIYANSGYGDLASPYATSRSPIALQVRCKASSDPTLTLSSRYSLTFGGAPQALAGDLAGAAAAGFIYRLDAGGPNTRQNMGFALYVRDVSAGTATGIAKNGLVRPGEVVPIVRFLNNPSISADYVADFNVYPGFFWANSNRQTEGGDFSSEVVVTLSFN
jgi:type 1 fimbria pilin